MKKLIHDFADFPEHVKLFHEFIDAVFPRVNFREFEQKGFWVKSYKPFSIVQDDKIVGNVCAAEMKLLIDGNLVNAVQVGGVGTLPEYRKMGISRRLMEFVFDFYDDKVDFFFLFAPVDVRDYYPRLGFTPIKEALFVCDDCIPKPAGESIKLNFDNLVDYNILVKTIKNRLPISTIFGAEDYDYITMWYVINFFKNSIYYIKEENVIVIKEEKDGILSIIDVIFTDKINWDNILPKVIESNDIREIRYYFTPDQVKYKHNKVFIDNNGLHIKGNFRLLEQKVRFPFTAVT